MWGFPRTFSVFRTSSVEAPARCSVQGWGFSHWLSSSGRLSRTARKVVELSAWVDSYLTRFGFLLQACAHRWKNVFYRSEQILPHGYCAIVPPTLQGRTKPLIPCYEGTVEAAWRTATAQPESWFPFIYELKSFSCNMVSFGCLNTETEEVR